MSQSRQFAAIMPASPKYYEGGRVHYSPMDEGGRVHYSPMDEGGFTDLSAGSRIGGRRFGLDHIFIIKPINNG